MALRTAGEVDSTWTLRDLERTVTAAEGHGGWLPLVFHHVCGGSRCGGLAVRATMLDAFARWLAQRQRLGTVVRTVGQVTGGPGPRDAARRAGRAARDRQPVAGVGRLLGCGERLAGDHVRSPRQYPPMLDGGWLRAQHRPLAAHHGQPRGRWAERLTVTGYHSGDAKLLPQFDLGQCSLPVRPGRSYTLGSWYQSTAQTQYSVYYRTWSGRWVYWTSSPYFPASPGWAQARWATPPVPAGASGLSFGLTLFSGGSLTTDSYSFTATPPDLTRRIMDWVLLAILSAAGLAVAARVARRRWRQAKPAPVDRKRLTSSSSRR